MTNSERGTKTNVPSGGGEYQVFLNFRGCDTRDHFADSLYHFLDNAQIRIFMDDAEIGAGEIIEDKLMKAIDNSKLYIPIFSPNYASSHWCLIELARMMKNISNSKEDENKKAILPIFYNVEPEELKAEEPKLQKPSNPDAISSLEEKKVPSYYEALLDLEEKKVKQEKKFSTEDVERWRTALRKVPASKGLKRKDYSGDGQLSVSVVREVVKLLQIRQRRVPEHVVGMEGPIAAINSLLDIRSNDVRLIAICGMSGIGKTTLAEIIYSNLCPRFNNCCSFLKDIRETEEKDKGLVKLQEQLFFDITYYTNTAYRSNDWIKAIEDAICSKKVLIVLDDVSDGNQIQKLIGTKSLHFGSRILVTTKEKSDLAINGLTPLFYELNRLSAEDALQLFSKHAFRDDFPPDDYDTRSKELVSATGGLPIALQAIGAYLKSEKNEKKWEETIEKLRNQPPKEVVGKLKVTYDALELDQQNIFLDIACFLINKKVTEPIFVWENCHNFYPHIAIEVLSSRYMIEILDGRFWMHEQFKALGRKIANEERTRLWDGVNIVDELRSPEEKPNVLALYYMSWRDPIDAMEIKRFPHLQYLWLKGVKLQGDFAGCLSKLKWLELSHFGSGADRVFMPTNLHLKNVVVMDTFGYGWTEDAVKSLIKEAMKLKVLTINSCRLTHEIPTFPEHSVLEKLNISTCFSLKKISCSIGKLRWLTHLDFSHCGALKKLPEQIGKLEKLQKLSLQYCESLRELPDSVSKLKSLTKLDISWSGITRLPGTFRELSQLLTLDLQYCKEIQELPELPTSLTTLRVLAKSLETIPDISKLTNLVELLLNDGTGGYGRSKDRIQPCDLPCIGRLSKLRKLDLCLLKIRATSIEWGSLSLLEGVHLTGLVLQTLKRLPSNLRVLYLRHTQVEQVELDGLPNLEELTVSGCKPVARLSITSSLIKLRHVRVEFCKKLVEVQFHGVLESMESLHIEYVASLERLVCLSEEEIGCNELQAPELTDASRRVSLISSSLKMLQKLTLQNCPKLQEIQFVSTLEALEYFDVYKCISLKRIIGLSNMKNLKKLRTTLCDYLQVVEGIHKLERLERLKMSECRSMETTLDVSSSKIPKECEIHIFLCGRMDPIQQHLGGYKGKIVNAQTQASDTTIETTFSEIGNSLSEQQDDGGEDVNNREHGCRKDKDDEDNEDDGGDDDDGDNVREDHENDESEDDEVDNVHSSCRSLLVCSEDDNDENDDVDEEGEGESDSDSNSKDDKDEDDGKDDKDEYKNEHEVLQSSRGPPPVCSVGDNDENNEVSEEGKGDNDSNEDRMRSRQRKRDDAEAEEEYDDGDDNNSNDYTSDKEATVMKTTTRATTTARTTTSMWMIACKSIYSCLAGLCKFFSVDNGDEKEEGGRRKEEGERQRPMRWRRRD